MCLAGKAGVRPTINGLVTHSSNAGVCGPILTASQTQAKQVREASGQSMTQWHYRYPGPPTAMLPPTTMFAYVCDQAFSFLHVAGQAEARPALDVRGHLALTARTVHLQQAAGA